MARLKLISCSILKSSLTTYVSTAFPSLEGDAALRLKRQSLERVQEEAVITL